jgi:hypothetical protein
VHNIVVSVQQVYRDNNIRHNGIVTKAGKLGIATAEFKDDKVPKVGY